MFLHGTGQFSKTWETTPDGREGFQTIFLRRRFPVCLIDQPRRGNASRSTVSAPIEATPDEQTWFDTFRVGIWPDYFPGVQFSKDTEALYQYFRQMAPNVGQYDPEVVSEACAAQFNKIGPAVLRLTRKVVDWDGRRSLRPAMCEESYRMNQAAASCFRREKFQSRCQVQAGRSRPPACPWRSSPNSPRFPS